MSRSGFVFAASTLGDIAIRGPSRGAQDTARDVSQCFVSAIPTNALFGKVRISSIIWLRFVNLLHTVGPSQWVCFCILQAALSRGCGEAASRTRGEVDLRHASRAANRVRAGGRPRPPVV